MASQEPHGKKYPTTFSYLVVTGVAGLCIKKLHQLYGKEIPFMYAGYGIMAVNGLFGAVKNFTDSNVISGIHTCTDIAMTSLLIPCLNVDLYRLYSYSWEVAICHLGLIVPPLIYRAIKPKKELDLEDVSTAMNIVSLLAISLNNKNWFGLMTGTLYVGTRYWKKKEELYLDLDTDCVCNYGYAICALLAYMTLVI